MVTMGKIAYLTIDDGPSKTMKEKANILALKDISAVWFCVGRFLKKRPEHAIHAIETGSIVGNHSYTHPRFSNIPLNRCLWEIQETDKAIEEIYSRAGVGRPAKFFRFPYGDKGDLRRWGFNHSEFSQGPGSEGSRRKEKIQSFLKGLGYIQPEFEGITYAYYRKERLSGDVDWFWTYDVMEWTTFEKVHSLKIDNLKKVFERMEEDAPEDFRGLNHAGSDEIIVIHDHTQTTHMFEPIIEKLLAMGVVFKSPLLR